MKKVILASAVSLSVFTTYAQSNKQALSWGFDFGLNYSSLPVIKASMSNIQKVTTPSATGFRLGIFMDLNLTKHLSIIAKPELAFYGNKVTVIKSDNSMNTYEVPPMAELSASLKYKLLGKGMQPYIIAGPGYKIPVIDNSIKNMQFARPVISADLGIGLEKRFPKFSVAPELRYSYGVNNISSIPGVQKATLNSFVFTVNFKG